MKNFRKIIILILIQAFLVSNIAWAGGLELSLDNKLSKSTLSPQIAIDINVFQSAYNIYTKKIFLTEDINLPQGLISIGDILEHGVIINEKSFNFKIGKNSFRIPPYLAGKIARLHITAINQYGFEFQKMGIGVGRRKKTIAVVLVDINNIDNQLLIFGQDDKALLKPLDKEKFKEIVLLGNKGQFSNLQRQDSFLERSKHGLEFVDSVLNVNQEENRARGIVKALSSLADENPKLRSNLQINMAFFSQQYVVSFSRELVKYSNVSILRDREQRGRFIAIVDRINPDNYVVFERKADQVFLVGKTSKVIIEKISNKEKIKVFNFTDFKQAAEFCQKVSKNLVVFEPAIKTGGFSIRGGVNLNFGIDNNDVRILKVNQVTQSTVTGYQVKHKAPSFEDITFSSYPLLILKSEFKDKISIDDIEINEDDASFMFFKADSNDAWPQYLSYSAGVMDQAYYQRIEGEYLRDGKNNIVYRYIEDSDIHTRIKFSENGDFTISGISWKDNSPVVFSNVKQISLPSIITQLTSSEYINVDSGLEGQFGISEIRGTQQRATFKFKKGKIEQAPTVRIENPSVFEKIQKNEDKKIKKYQNKNKLRIPKAALIFSVFSMVFSATNLFAAGMGDMVFDVNSRVYFIESLLASSVPVLGMILAAINPIAPIVGTSELNEENKEKFQTKKKKEEDNKPKEGDYLTISEQAQQKLLGNRYEGNQMSAYSKPQDVQAKTSTDVFISDAGKLLSANQDLLEEIKNSINVKGQTYFSLKPRDSEIDKTFIIRPLKTVEEAREFNRLLDVDINFDWERLFNMIELYKKNAKGLFIYGVFALDAYGQEERIVAAGTDYISRDMSGKIILKIDCIEVLPEMRKNFSGIGTRLLTRLISDALTVENFSLTQGRVAFTVENNGQEKSNAFKFYKEALKLMPKTRKTSNGKIKKTMEFDLSLEDVIEFLQRGFRTIGFFTQLNFSNELGFKTNDLVQINLSSQEFQLVNQAI